VVEAVGDRGACGVAVFRGRIVVTFRCVGFLFFILSGLLFGLLSLLQALDLVFDFGDHFDAEIVALEQYFECGDRGGVTPRAERVDYGPTNIEIGLVEIRSDLLRDFFVLFIEAGKAGDCGAARVDGFAGL
jgi:hypothetical protein